MNKKLIITGLSLALLLTGCKAKVEETTPVAHSTSEVTIETQEPLVAITDLMAETQAYPELKQLIIDTYEVPQDYLSRTKYYYNYVDLNNDGAEEIFVVVMGPYTSGSGGSSAMIVYPVNDQLHVNQTMTLVQTPIIISDTITNGANEIIVYRSGGGAESTYVKLTCSDGYYTNVSDGDPIENLDGITGTAIIANDIIKDIDSGNFLTLE
jgi:hypothetical protein